MNFSPLLIAAMAMPSAVLRYAAAFFFILVAVALAYAAFKTGKMLGRIDSVLTDLEKEAMPLLKKVSVSLDEVNANLSNVADITEDVAGVTDKVDKLATSVETIVSTPARKAASFSVGAQSAVSSFLRRMRGDDDVPVAEPSAEEPTASAEPVADAAAPSPAEPAGDEVAPDAPSADAAHASAEQEA